MTPVFAAAIPLCVGRGVFRQTRRGHRCNTWRYHGKAGWECLHGHVLLRRDLSTGLLRANPLAP